MNNDRRYELKNIWIPQIIAVIMLAIALKPDTAYGYFALLRIVCCAVFGYLAVMAHRQEKKEWDRLGFIGNQHFYWSNQCRLEIIILVSI